MNFDTKYLIRWGIPGWTTMLVCLSTIIWVKKSELITSEFDIIQSLGALISLGFVGIVVGYIMHQIYFSWNWLFSRQSKNINNDLITLLEDSEKKDEFLQMNNLLLNNNDKKGRHKLYFSIEYEWHKQLLLNDEEKREYISERYRYLLSTVHALGALRVSFCSSLIGIGLICWYFTFFDFIILGFSAFLIYLLYAVHKGFQYYSSNLIHFQANFFNSFFNRDFN